MHHLAEERESGTGNKPESIPCLGRTALSTDNLRSEPLIHHDAEHTEGHTCEPAHVAAVPVVVRDCHSFAHGESWHVNAQVQATDQRYALVHSYDRALHGIDPCSGLYVIILLATSLGAYPTPEGQAIMAR